MFKGGEPLGVGLYPSEDLYAHPTADGVSGEYLPFVSSTKEELSNFSHVSGEQYGLFYAGANPGSMGSPAFRHLLSETTAALTSNAVIGAEGADNLYDSSGGQLYLVNVLPGGEVEPSATFGSPPEPGNGDESPPGLSNVISKDGSRVFWTSIEVVRDARGNPEYGRPKALYVRLNDIQAQSPFGEKDECIVAQDACTVQVDTAVGGGGFFWTASVDGSKVFFTKGDPTGELYVYDVEDGKTTDLTPGVAVAGVAGASENGEYVYYANANSELSVWHDGVSTPIATGEEFVNTPYGEGGGNGFHGDWTPSVGYRTAEVTPDGRSLVFMSRKDLTGYENKGLEEVFVYEAGSNRLTCVWCNRSGEPPVPTELVFIANTGRAPLVLSYPQGKESPGPISRVLFLLMVRVCFSIAISRWCLRIRTVG